MFHVGKITHELISFLSHNDPYFLTSGTVGLLRGGHVGSP